MDNQIIQKKKYFAHIFLSYSYFDYEFNYNLMNIINNKKQFILFQDAK